MMVVLIYNVACWTFIMGILKAWTFLVVFAVFFTSYLAHKVKGNLTSEIKSSGLIEQIFKENTLIFCPPKALYDILIFKGLTRYG